MPEKKIPTFEIKFDESSTLYKTDWMSGNHIFLVQICNHLFLMSKHGKVTVATLYHYRDLNDKITNLDFFRYGWDNSVNDTSEMVKIEWHGTYATLTLMNLKEIYTD